MSISSGNKITTTDMNSVINSIQTTYTKYGGAASATPASNGNKITISTINAAIEKLNYAINHPSNRRHYYYTGAAINSITLDSFISASSINLIQTTNSKVSNDYCNCYYDCSCDIDCCDYDCSCDADCYCDSNCCDGDCCDGDSCRDCNCDADCLVLDNGVRYCSCDSDCNCHYDCSCDSDCSCDIDCCDYDCS